MLDSGANQVLSVCLADGGAAEISVDQKERRIYGCTEWQPYEFTLSDSDGCDIFVDDARLPTKSGTSKTWLWSAGFFAGDVLLQVVDRDDKLRAEFTIVVSTAPLKLAPSDYSSMLAELFEFNAALMLGFESAQNSIGVEGSFQSVQLAYARLKFFGPAFVSALANLKRQPQTRLRHRRELVPLHRVRRIDHTTVRSALMNPDAFAVLKSTVHFGGVSKVPSFNVPSAEHTVDIPANWTMLALVHAFIRRVKNVRNAFEKMLLSSAIEVSEGEFKDRLPRRIHYLAKLESSLVRLTGTYPFNVLSRAEVSAAGLNTVAAHPVYGRAYRTGWCALRSGIEGKRGSELLWTSPTWQVYERWAFLQVVRLIDGLLPDGIKKVTYPSTREDCISISWTKGGFAVGAYLQARFPAYDQKEWRGFSSISRERYPDIVVTFERADVKMYLLFDAKYRVSRHGVLEGMESAHIYRDSLRWHGQQACASLLLIPAEGGAPWLESEEFRVEHEVGVVPLSISAGTQRLEMELAKYFHI